MTIGIDASRANHEQKTGVEWYAWHVIQNLKNSVPLDTEVILYSDVALVGDLAKLPSNWSSKVLGWPPKRLWTQARLSLEMLLNPPDVLFVPAHVPPLIHPKKTVMTVHDVAAIRYPQTYSWFERWYSVWSARWAVRKLWRIIVPSEFTKKELNSDSDKIKVIQHGVGKLYRKITDEIKIDQVLNKYGIKRPFIVSVGRLEEKKNTMRIVEAFGMGADNLQLVLVGKPGHGYKKVQEVIGKSLHKDKIITPGWINPEDVVCIMNAAEVFVFPSLYEGFGLPILEAFVCGTPVVTSHDTSLCEVGQDGCVYVDPINTESIAKGLVDMLSNEKLRQEKIGRGFEIVKQFSWKKCAEETTNILLS